MLSQPVTAATPPTAGSGTSVSDTNPGLVHTRTIAAPAARPETPQSTSPDPTADSPLWATEQVCRFWRPASSCLISLVLHALLVIFLGLHFLAPSGTGKSLSLMASTVDGSQKDSLETEEFQADSAAQVPSEATVSTFEQTAVELVQSIDAEQAAGAAASQSFSNADPTTDLLRQASASALGSGETIGVGDGDVKGALSGRGAAVRGQLALGGGGSPASEDAVSRGLRWLQAHQRPDGSWCFDLKQTPCAGLCSDSGSETSATGATGLALLAFLGRGETHLDGDYQETVKRGLYFLTSQMLITSQGGDLRGTGNMYSHGIASIALCEAYAMTHDKDLEPFAQKAIDFIISAQDPRGGGWRYVPGIPGDTTVSGWQVMALKSGQMGYLRVPYETMQNAGRFLDSVQSEKGSRYRYLPSHPKEGKELTTTSVGLLCRMYLGWPKEHPGLRKGVDLLTKEGPSMLGRNSNMYYNYYATQIMHQYGGEPWEIWNSQMRDYLVHTQAQEGHESGSWYFDGGQAQKGGRLYVTAVAIMTLEVYYRHMPLYAAHAVGY